MLARGLVLPRVSPEIYYIMVLLFHRELTLPLAKQCYHCQGLGHVQADCPTLRLNGGTSGRCYNCNQPGHLAVSVSYPSSDERL